MFVTYTVHKPLVYIYNAHVCVCVLHNLSCLHTYIRTCMYVLYILMYVYTYKASQPRERYIHVHICVHDVTLIIWPCLR